MKTETQIAQENVKKYLKLREVDDGAFVIRLTTKESTETAIDFLQTKAMCSSHKATCQRFLEFLGKNGADIIRYHTCGACNDVISKEIFGKVADLKQAIKLYEDNKI